MAIKEVSFGRTINVGNYESERYDVTVTLEPGQTPEDGVYEARAFIARQRQQVTEAQRLEERVKEAKSHIRWLLLRITKVHARHKQIAEAYEQIRAALPPEEAEAQRFQQLTDAWPRLTPLSDEEVEEFERRMLEPMPELFPDEEGTEGEDSSGDGEDEE